MDTIETSAEIQRLVQAKLASGRYASEAELLLAALHSLEAMEAQVAAIEEGIEDFRRGRTEPFDQADAEFRRKHHLPLDA